MRDAFGGGLDGRGNDITVTRDDVSTEILYTYIAGSRPRMTSRFHPPSRPFVQRSLMDSTLVHPSPLRAALPLAQRVERVEGRR